MIKAPTARKGITIGLALVLILGIAPQISSQETSQNPIREAAEIAFAGGTPFMTADVLYENLNDGDTDNDPTIISLRSADDYAKGHVPGAIHMDITTLFTAEGLATIPPDRTVVFVCYTGQSASYATSALNMLGYDAFALKFGMSAWTGDPEVFVKRFNPDAHTFDYPIDLEVHQPGGPYAPPAPLATTVAGAAEAAFEGGARFITADVLYENLNDGDEENDPTIIGLRSADDYAKGHLPGAVLMDVKTLFTADGLATIPPDRSVVFVCYTGQSASQATSALNMLGYDALALKFGMSAWTSDPEVYVKRFDPDVHTFDYTVDLETHQPGGPYQMPEPLVEPVPALIAAPPAINVVAASAEIAFAGGTPFMTADVLYENLNDGDTDNDPTIISLRSAEDYAKGHVPGAILMDIKTLFTSEGLEPIPPDRTVVFVCYTGQSASYATSALNMLGYDAFALKFGMSAWTGDPEVFVKRFNPDTHTFDYPIDLEVHQPGGPYSPPAPLATTLAGAAEAAFEGGPRLISADDLYENLNDGDADNDPTIISVRSADDYAKGHVPGAINMGLTTLFTAEGLATIPRDKSVVVVCYTGQSASQATSALNMLGYDASALTFGMSAWTSDPDVYVKRFNPDAHTFDYPIDLEAHQPGGPYQMPEPLVEPVPVLISAPPAIDVVAASAEIVFEAGARYMTADALYENLNDGDSDNDPTIISLRSADDYANGHVPGAIHMDITTLFTAEGLATIPPDKSVVFVCYTGQSASQATSGLNMLGYDAFALTFGMSAWTGDPEVFVKRFNPDVHAFDYTVDLEAHQPGGPYAPPAPLATTLAGAAEAAFEGGPRLISADDLYENLNDGDADNDPTIISVRSADDYAKGHVPGAINMGLTTLFTAEGLATIPRDKSVVVVCYTGQSASQATSALNMLGYDASALTFGMSAWTSDPDVYVKRFNPDAHTFDYPIDLEAHQPGGPYQMPEPLVEPVPVLISAPPAIDVVAASAEIVFEAGARYMTADALYENLNDGDSDNDPTIISLRSADDYANGHVPGAIHMDITTLFTAEGLATIPPDKSVVFVCYTGQSASQATSGLNMLGYDAFALTFGMSAWTGDPEVFVKRFNPDVHAFDYPIDLEVHQPGGPYAPPAPLATTLAGAAEAAFEGGPRLISADDLYENLNDGDADNDPTIISVRSADDYAKGHVPGAINMGLTTLFTAEGLATIPPDKSVVVVCYTGQSASQATSALNMLGYDASALTFGMSAWTSDPEVFVKRFNPDVHTFDYTVDLEAHQPGGPYQTPEPLVDAVQAAPQPIPEPTAPPVAEAPVTAVASNCVSCHTDQETLETLAVDKEIRSDQTSGEG